MKSTNEWYRKINSYSNPSEMNDVPREWVETMINEARVEALTEVMKDFIEKLKALHMAIPTNTKENRAIKGAYVHAIMIAKEYVDKLPSSQIQKPTPILITETTN